MPSKQHEWPARKEPLKGPSHGEPDGARPSNFCLIGPRAIRLVERVPGFVHSHSMRRRSRCDTEIRSRALNPTGTYRNRVRDLAFGALDVDGLTERRIRRRLAIVLGVTLGVATAFIALFVCALESGAAGMSSRA